MLTVNCGKMLVEKKKSIFTTHLDISTPFDTNNHQEKKKKTPYQLYLHDKSKINIGNAMNYLALVVQIVHVCGEK